jgi:hypothetical protein
MRTRALLPIVVAIACGCDATASRSKKAATYDSVACQQAKWNAANAHEVLQLCINKMLRDGPRTCTYSGVRVYCDPGPCDQAREELSAYKARAEMVCETPPVRIALR